MRGHLLGLQCGCVVCRRITAVWLCRLLEDHLCRKASFLFAGKRLIRVMEDRFGSIENVRNAQVGLKNDRQFKLSSRFDHVFNRPTRCTLKNTSVAKVK